MCLECSKESLVRGLTYGQPVTSWCGNCHTKLSMAIEEIKFFSHQPSDSKPCVCVSDSKPCVCVCVCVSDSKPCVCVCVLVIVSLVCVLVIVSLVCVC